jgi:predicted RNA binding protein YcfA (HicA-like mRNA interferase family)
MTKVPSLHYEKVLKALRRDGWVVVRQKGSHDGVVKSPIYCVAVIFQALYIPYVLSRT